jgi:hypothetical protein
MTHDTRHALEDAAGASVYVSGRFVGHGMDGMCAALVAMCGGGYDAGMSTVDPGQQPTTVEPAPPEETEDERREREEREERERKSTDKPKR